MIFEIPVSGAASPDVMHLAHQVWRENSIRSGVDSSRLDPSAPLADRLEWARDQGLEIGCILSRYSTKLQHSTDEQVRDCIQFAAAHGIYVPSEYICVDEAVSGRKADRDGLRRLKAILGQKLARTLLVFKVSRLFRVAYRGFKFFQEDVVEEGLRAISVSQGVDTAEEKTWKQLAYLHGIMDEMLVATIADHVRSGISSLFQRGYVTGALTFGFKRVEVPDARPTNRGRPRTIPAVDEEVAPLIRRHFEWIRDGMPIKEGWRRWVKAGGPCDPRSTEGYMTYPAYRGMLSNQRYVGLWAFGRKRNVYMSKADYMTQKTQPDSKVLVVQSEDLRIVSDELFHAVQERLSNNKTAPRGPKRRRKDLQLWDMVTDCFYCRECAVRFYHSGVGGKSMACKRMDVCPRKSAVDRQAAVRAVCQKLSQLLCRDERLIEETVAQAVQLAAEGDESIREKIAAAERRIGALTRKLDDLLDLAGEGSDADRSTMKAKIRAVQQERTERQVELERLTNSLRSSADSISAEQVRSLLEDLFSLLSAGASGELGDDVVYLASDAFRRLIGGRIDVQVEDRPGRKRKNVRGWFSPPLQDSTARKLNDAENATVDPTWVWLRKPPRMDALAERVHELIDVERLTFREAAKVLTQEAGTISSEAVRQIHQRYYEIVGRPVPDRLYNNGRPRRCSN